MVLKYKCRDLKRQLNKVSLDNSVLTRRLDAAHKRIKHLETMLDAEDT